MMTEWARAESDRRSLSSVLSRKSTKSVLTIASLKRTMEALKTKIFYTETLCNCSVCGRGYILYSQGPAYPTRERMDRDCPCCNPSEGGEAEVIGLRGPI